MSINYYYEETDSFNIPLKVKGWIVATIQTEKKKAGEISFIFCSDNYLLKINQDYLQHDYYTDVITFDYVDGNLISGDIFISVDRVKENSEVLSLYFWEELNRIMVHGVLHLIGYKDKTDEEKELMTAKEDEYLTKL